MPTRFRNLSPAQERAFERIAINQPPQCSKKTLQALLDAGLIYRYEEVTGVDVFGAIVVDAYEVPVSVHVEWCRWCDEQLTDEDPCATVGR